MLIGIEMTIFGSILNPFVSSSKNLSRPALDAGRGAFFFLSAMPCNKNKKVKIDPKIIICMPISIVAVSWAIELLLSP